MALPASVIEHVNEISPLDDSTWRKIEKVARHARLGAREYVSAFGQVARSVGLMHSGWVRAYTVDSDGREYTSHLFKAPALVGDYASLLSGEPVRVAQQALTECELHWVGWKWLQELSAHHRCIEVLMRQFAEACFSLNERRKIDLATKSAGERYEIMLAEYPDVEQAIPQYEVAAYLAITPTQLSRIRAERKEDRLNICK